MKKINLMKLHQLTMKEARRKKIIRKEEKIKKNDGQIFLFLQLFLSYFLRKRFIFHHKNTVFKNIIN